MKVIRYPRCLGKWRGNPPQKPERKQEITEVRMDECKNIPEEFLIRAKFDMLNIRNERD